MPIASQKINPCLWFDTQGEEAATFYTDVFEGAKVLKKNLYPESATAESGKPAGSVMTVDFKLGDTRFVALNGGPTFKFNEAISFMIICDDQKEVDYFWEKLTDGGEESVCGWLKDKYGMSWQIVPKQFEEMMNGDDPVRVQRMVDEMMTQQRLDIAKLRAAYDGEPVVR